MPGIIRLRVSGLAAALLMCCAAPALAASFTFEDLSAGPHPSPLVVTNDGLTLTATTEGFPNGYLYVYDVGVPLLGLHALVGTQTGALETGRFAPIRFTFSHLVGDITFAFGDAGGDEDSPVTINAYGVGDVLLGTLSDSYPQFENGGRTLSGSFAGASYFIVSSGSNIGNPDSLGWEIPSVSLYGVVPEPSSLALVGLAVPAAVLARRRLARPRA